MARFPSATRRRIAAVVLACLTLGGLSAPLALADDLKDKQKQVKKEIKAAHSDLNESSAQLRAATIALREAQAALSSAQAHLAETRGKLTAAQVKDQQMQAKLEASIKALALAREELALGKQEVEVQRVAVGDMIAKIYEMGDPRLLGFVSLLNAEDPGDITRQMAATDAVVQEENTLLDNLRAAEVLLAVKEHKVEEKKGEVEVQRQAAAEHLKLMQMLEEQAAAAEQSVRVLVGQRQSMLAAAEKAKAKDKAMLVSLRAEESRISEMLKARALAAAQAGGGAKNSNGFLSFPVNGHITSPFGYRTHPIYGYWGLHNGTDFGASCGAPLLAGADGQVVERGYDSVYGNYLVVDHGHQAGVGLAAKYNHATHYVVGSGDQVRRGQVVGYMGSTGWSTGCHLHFSVLANGSYVDPMGWF